MFPASLCVGLLLSLLPGCRGPGGWSRAADDAVYRIVEQRRAQILEQPDAFRIEPSTTSLRQSLLEGESAALEGVRSLSLVECLEIAAENSREFQDQRERLYLAALDLTLQQYEFAWQTQGVFAGTLDGVGDEAQGAEPAGNLTLSRLLGTGARVVGGLGLSLFKDLSGGDGWQATSTASLSIVQPLLAGADPAIVREPLTQAERSVLYAARDYERFRRGFGLDVAARLYRILQQVDALKNEQANYQNLILLRTRNENLAESGRLSGIQVDQARQDELRAKSRLIDTQARLDTALDEFKLFLGLPVEIDLGIDPAEFAALRETDFTAADPPEMLAQELALQQRLDWLSVRDRIGDADRRLYVAQDQLGARANLTLDANLSSDAGQPLDFHPGTSSWTLGFDFDLPIDRLSERNTFRRAQISLNAAKRSAEEFSDQIRSSLRDQLRTLRSARDEYQIQLRSVSLAERRVDSASLNLEAGRAETRDLLEAQESLVGAQNAATVALIDFRLATLRFYLEVEALRVGPEGLYVDPKMQAALLQETS